MNNRQCPKCGEEYSDTYRTCPFCEEEAAIRRGERDNLSAVYIKMRTGRER